MGRGVSSPLLRRTCVVGGEKGYHIRRERAVEQIVSPVELRYEGPMYERPVYPGTLTHHETVPTIEVFRPVERQSAAQRGRYRVDQMVVTR